MATTTASAIRASEDLSQMDVVLLRQDPPFDMSYITTTHLLERIHPKTLVVNDPAHVRNAPEKVFVLDFLDLMPPTLVTRNLERRAGLPRRAQGHHPEAALRQRRRLRVPHRRGRHQPQLAGRAVPDRVPRALHGAAVSPRGARRRQAHHPGRRRSGGRHQSRAGRRRDALQHARRRRCHGDRTDGARPGDLRNGSAPSSSGAACCSPAST